MIPFKHRIMIPCCTQLLAMQADPDADLLKLATTAQSPADTTRLLAATQSFTHQFDKPLTTMAMSEFNCRLANLWRSIWLSYQFWLSRNT